MSVPEYNGFPCISGEKRLSLAEVRSLIAASIFFGVLEHAVGKGFDYDRVRQSLLQSLAGLKELSPEERVLSLQLIARFRKFKMIRAEHSFDDWLCEAFWEQFQVIPYAYPSAMSEAVSNGLSVSLLLNECSLEY